MTLKVDRPINIIDNAKAGGVLDEYMTERRFTTYHFLRKHIG